MLREDSPGLIQNQDRGYLRDAGRLPAFTDQISQVSSPTGFAIFSGSDPKEQGLLVGRGSCSASNSYRVRFDSCRHAPIPHEHKAEAKPRSLDIYDSVARQCHVFFGSPRLVSCCPKKAELKVVRCAGSGKVARVDRRRAGVRLATLVNRWRCQVLGRCA